MRYLLILAILVSSCEAFAQKKDTPPPAADSIFKTNSATVTADSLRLGKPAKKVFIPRTAAIRSAILPGWGQVYNKKYWKVPIVYGALGTTAAVFFFNISQYNKVQFAYRSLILKDTAMQKLVGADLQPFIAANATNDLRNYRNEYRKDIDYSVLIFLVFWGLNVVDATVDAHLKGFDVSDDLSLKIKPGYSQMANTTGISMVFDIHKGRISSR